MHSQPERRYRENAENVQACRPQLLAKQLTLSQQGGRLCMPITVLQAPQIFRPCDGPGIFSQA